MTLFHRIQKKVVDLFRLRPRITIRLPFDGRLGGFYIIAVALMALMLGIYMDIPLLVYKGLALEDKFRGVMLFWALLSNIFAFVAAFGYSLHEKGDK